MSSEAVQDLERLLARKQALAAATPQIESRLRELRGWQAARLARTYRDLHEDPRHAPAVEFFLSDLYGAEGFEERDRNVTRAWPYLKRSLPEAPLQALARAIEIEVLTGELDHAMATALTPGALTEKLYAKAYREVGRRDARQRQIDLIIGAGEQLERAVRHVWIGALLRTSHGAAHAAGFGVLQDFIERGYRAFRHLGNAQKLLTAIRVRETAIMEALFAGAPDPFKLADDEPGR